VRPVGAAWAHGVRTVVDLRNADEYVPDARRGRRAYHRAGTAGAGRHTVLRALEKIDNLSSPLYFPRCSGAPGAGGHRRAGDRQRRPGCVVFHCAGGKDRTGLLALVLLTLAGAAPEEIIADYC